MRFLNTTVAATGIIALSLVLPARAQTSAVDADDYINPDRPGIADGSNVVGAGHFQIEAGVQYERRAHGDDRTVFIPTLLRAGLGESWELRVETNGYDFERTRDPGAGDIRSEGAAPTSIGLKYHFVDGQGASQPSIGAIVRVFPASGSGDFRTHRTTGDFRLAADWDFAPNWSLNPNLGVAVYEDDANQQYTAGLAAVTLSYNPEKTLSLFVDTGLQTPEARYGKTALTYDAGVAYLPTRNIQLDISVGVGAAGQTPPHPFLAVGVSGRF